MIFELEFSEQAKEDYKHHKKIGNKSVLNKIKRILEELTTTPYEGIGKPEALKHELNGSWSRRINLVHRVVYQVIENVVYIESIKGHYE